MGALSTIFFTMGGELHDTETGNMVVLTLFASGAACGIGDIFFVNMAMQFYE